MSQVFMATVVVAGTAQSVQQFDELIQREEAASSNQGLRRTVLSPDAQGHPVAVEYAAQASRQRPILWEVACGHTVAGLELLVLRLWYEEQGDGAVVVERGTENLFESFSIYGYDDEGQGGVREARRVFAQAARSLFGLHATMRFDS